MSTVQLSKIVFKLSDGVGIALSLEEAQDLYTQLGNLFGHIHTCVGPVQLPSVSLPKATMPYHPSWDPICEAYAAHKCG
jgi:hypothetical protein